MPTPRKRILIHRPGGYGTLRVDFAPIQDPGPGEIQVAVQACGINFADVFVRLGLYAAAKGRYPLCPGLEFAGIVRGLATKTPGLKVGDRVFGVTRFGGYTSVINCPPEQLWPLPPSWDFKRGAAFPVAYLTAYHALFHVAQLKPYDKVLVHSAAGGVGTALLHLLGKNGNFSVGVVGRSSKMSAAREAGAKAVIDKRSMDLWGKAEEISPGGYDLILDANGASTLKNSYKHLGPMGRLVIYGFASMLAHSGRKGYLRLLLGYLLTPRFSPFDLTGANKTVSGFNLIYLFDRVELFRKAMEQLLRWRAAGAFPQMPVTPFSFEDVAEAHKALESGCTIGKLVLLIED